jgi:hypothetical protein
VDRGRQVLTALTWLVGLAFIWSIALYVLAIFFRERRQEAGLGYSLGGAALFWILFSDRLPFAWTGLREPLLHLPGGRLAGLDFRSPVVALLILLALYVLRVIVFHRLINPASQYNRADPSEKDAEDREDINDVVAPALAFFCLLTCFAAIVQEAYALQARYVALLVAVLLVIYYVGALRFLWQHIQPIIDSLAVLVRRLWRHVRRIPLYIIVLLASLEAFRRRSALADNRLRNWAADRLAKLDDDDARSSAEERERLAQIAERLRSQNQQREV